MPTNESIVELVKFKADGIADISEATRLMSRQVNESAENLKKFRALTESGSYLRYAQTTERIAKAHELAGARLRNVLMQQRLNDGSASRQLASMTKLNQTYERMRREAEMIASYGETAGRFMAKWGGTIGTAGRIATGAAATGVGTVSALAHRGFSGTVEGSALDNEWSLLSREVASSFKPLAVLARNVVRSIRERMERWDRNTQDMFMIGGLGVSGALAAKSLFGGGMLARLAGLGGAGGGAGGATTLGSVGRFVAGGGGLGSLGGLGLGFASTTAIGAASVGAEIGRAGGRSRFMRGLETGSAADMTMGALNYVSPGSYFTGKAMDMLGFGRREEAPAERRPEGPNPERRMVMLSGGGWEEQGSGFARLNTAISKMQAGGAENDAELGPVLSKLVAAIERVERFFGGASAERSGG